MNGPEEVSHPLTNADCDACLRIVEQRHGQTAQELELMKRAGFDLPDQAARNDANKQFALGLVRTYFPHRAPYNQ